MNKIVGFIFIVLSLSFAKTSEGQTIDVSVEIPKISANPYHKPYVAVWLETEKRKGVYTLAFWKEQPEWYKDLRQWWRKIGRKNSPNYDGVSGATRKPGTYQLTWDGKLPSGKTLPAGTYVIHIEAVREQGSREYLRQTIQLGGELEQTFQLNGQSELGAISINISK